MSLRLREMSHARDNLKSYAASNQCKTKNCNRHQS